MFPVCDSEHAGGMRSESGCAYATTGSGALSRISREAHRAPGLMGPLAASMVLFPNRKEEVEGGTDTILS